MLLLLLLLLLLVFPRKVNRHRYQRMVQSADCNIIDLIRNFDLRGPGDRQFSDLDDGEDKLVDLGLEGSDCLMHLLRYILILLY